EGSGEGRGSGALRRLALVTTVATLGLMLLGGYVKATNAGLACPDWPRCFGTWYPFGAAAPNGYQGYSVAQVATEWTHRFVASVVGPMILATCVLAWMQRPRDRRAVVASTAALLILPVQIVMGGVTVTSGLEPLVVVAHLGFAILIFGGLVATTLFAWWPRQRGLGRQTGVPTPSTTGGVASGAGVSGASTGMAYLHTATAVAVSSAGTVFQPRGTVAPMAPLRTGGMAFASLGATWSDYVTLVKPGILFLLLVEAGAGLLVAPGPLTWTVALAVLVGGAMSASAASAFNHVLERDRDRKMTRTSQRPVASERIRVRDALVFASVLAVGSVLVMGLGANWLAAGLAFAGLLFYVLVYTMWLKPRTPQNIVIGGAAGCFPALAGWAAVTGDLGVPALLLGALVFLWTPPHFWALAIVYKEDYANAGFPMHPVVHGERSTKIQMLVYAVLTVLVSVLLVWPWPVLGTFYLACAVVLGGIFVWYAWATLQSDARQPARRLFWYSIVYLTALYVAMGIDVAVQGAV
ncbi:MAG TPA: heme o synthase, partial [Candidatus Thermoplasmatota archaeon]|nr:heme o synthase [Candidatus Thermoplasmatota archaeon]